MADHDSPTIPQVHDRRPKIAGLLPKNAQNKVLAGIALLMVLVIMFSGRKGAQPKAPTPMSAAAMVVDPSQARIREYRSRLDEQTRRLAEEEARLSQSQHALGMTPRPADAAPTAARPIPAPSVSWDSPPAYHAEPERNWMEIDREKRAYQSLYASNIALSYRPSSDERSLAGLGGRGWEASPARREPGASPRAVARHDPDADGAYRLSEGTILETVLTNRLDSSLAGPVNCMVTTNVYSRDRQALLIPQGARVLGEAYKLDNLGEQRLAVVFHRLVMPDGSSVTLDKFQGLNQIGETGFRDQVNHHYVEVFGVSIALGALAGLAQANTRYSLDESPTQAYEQGVTSSLSQSSTHILDRYLNVLPTFTIREGYRVKIYLSQDLSLPAYASHGLLEDK